MACTQGGPSVPVWARLTTYVSEARAAPTSRNHGVVEPSDYCCEPARHRCTSQKEETPSKRLGIA